MLRKDAILAAVAGLLASCGFAMADDLQTPNLSLAPTVTADDAAPAPTNLMTALDKVGAGSTLKQLGINISGFVEAGYTYDHRHHESRDSGTGILPGPFNTELGNHFMLNQLDLQIERDVATDKFDVGGLIEVMYGQDAGKIHSSGLGFNGSDPTTDDNPREDGRTDTERAFYQFDLTQAFVTVNVPVGNGLKLTIGKFVSLLGAETINPTGNLFYSHSWAFGAFNYTNTGILGTYKVNDMLTVTAGFSRGWDMSLEDNHACAIDGIGSFIITPMKNVTVNLNWSVGPEDWNDTSHYRTVIDPVAWWQVNDQLKLGLEAYYLYDGGINSPTNSNPAADPDSSDFSGPRVTHAYGDEWGGVLYASYMINDMFTLNARVEKYHRYVAFPGSSGDSSSGVSSTNVYGITLGTTITPFPKDPLGQNLSFRPEVRYDYCEDHVFRESNGAFKDELTFAADVIFKF